MDSQNGQRQWSRSQLRAISQEIQALYDAGTPFFTKENIRRVGEELWHFQNGERNNGAKVMLRGVNGVDYEKFINPPVSEQGQNEHVGGAAWAINYKPATHLTSCQRIEYYNVEEAYLPMFICAPIRRIGGGLTFPNPPTPPEEDFSIYQTIVQQWESSQHFEQVRNVLASVEIPFAVTKVIGLGLGPLVISSRPFERTILQHALVPVLRKTFSIPSEAYVQDPAYTQRDRDIIGAAGLTVLEDPDGLLELDQYSILLTISPNLPIQDIVADICRPGIIIWNRLPTERPPSCGPRALKMMENEYRVIPFPNHTAFRDLVMLVRKADLVTDCSGK